MPFSHFVAEPRPAPGSIANILSQPIHSARKNQSTESGQAREPASYEVATAPHRRTNTRDFSLARGINFLLARSTLSLLVPRRCARLLGYRCSALSAAMPNADGEELK